MIISPYSFGGGGGGGGSTLNPAWSNVVLALDGDGANGDPVVDSKNGYTPEGTYLGGIEISTAEGKFGGSSIFFDGTSGLVYSRTGADANFQFAGDFCIRLFAYWDGSTTDARVIFDMRDSPSSSTGLIFYVDTDSFLKIYQGVGFLYQATVPFPTGTWVHLAVTRSATDLRIFQDGVQLVNTTCAGSLTAGRFAIGSLNESYSNPTIDGWSGYFDQVEVANGEPVYTTGFVPPTAPYPDM